MKNSTVRILMLAGLWFAGLGYGVAEAALSEQFTTVAPMNTAREHFGRP